MREAMAWAEVGDEQEREDPTVLALEQRVAALLGHEDAVYLPTATMGNEIALVILGERGTELVVEATAHIMVSELGGAAAFSGLQTRGLPGFRGRLTPEQIRATTHADGSFHTPRTSIVALENTHNTAGGTIWPIHELRAVVETARELEIHVHLDGARLLNASVAQQVAPAELAGMFDTVTLCLSKGLGCPLGALIAGSAELMHRARREKHRFGGAMRQAGIIAAAGLYALDHNVARLSEDHTNAKILARGLAEIPGVAINVAHVESNLVFFDVAGTGLTAKDVVDRLAARGVRMGASGRTRIRAVTHLDVSQADVERAVAVAQEVLGKARAGALGE